MHPADRGGVQNVCTRLAAHLRAHGHTVVQAWPAEHPERASGHWTCALPPLVWRSGLPAPRSLYEASRALLRVASLLARTRPTVVNVHFVTSEALYFQALRPLFGYRLVLSVHGSDVLRPQPADARQLPGLLRRADAVTAVSALTGARVEAVHGVSPDRIQVIPNGIDYAFWRAADVAGAASRTRPIVLSVGRLDPVKGPDILLRAFPHVAARVADARLVIVGDGGFRPELQRLASELGIGSAVEFAGQIDADGVRARLTRAATFVLPSRSEGLPLALLEAMAAGVPVVATRVGGVPEILVPGTGVIVAPEDPVRLGTAIADLLLDADRRAALGRAASERAADFAASAADAAYQRLLVEVARGEWPPPAAATAEPGTITDPPLGR